MIDYHTHTWRCGHARGAPRAYVQKAREKGILEIGISDHYPMDILGLSGFEGCAMPYRELELYVRDVRSVQNEIDEPPVVRLGIEMDYIPGKEEKTKALLAHFDWDYVIGSVHFLNDIDISHPDNADYYRRQPALDVMNSYFNVIKKMVESGLFDIIGHIDVIKKFGYPGSGQMPLSDLKEMYTEMARLCKDRNQVVEVNTSGLRAPIEEIYPSYDLLTEMARFQVPLTLGSDAHDPLEVGYEHETVTNILRTFNINSLTGFENREPFEISII